MSTKINFCRHCVLNEDFGYGVVEEEAAGGEAEDGVVLGEEALGDEVGDGGGEGSWGWAVAGGEGGEVDPFEEAELDGEEFAEGGVGGRRSSKSMGDLLASREECQCVIEEAFLKRLP